MKCYRCNNKLNEDDKVCSKCGSKVIRYKAKPKTRTKNNKNENYNNEYYDFAIGCIITRFISYLLAFILPFNLIIPWLLMSFVFSIFGYVKYNDKKYIKLIIIDICLIVLELILFIVFFKFIINLF